MRRELEAVVTDPERDACAAMGGPLADVRVCLAYPGGPELGHWLGVAAPGGPESGHWLGVTAPGGPPLGQLLGVEPPVTRVSCKLVNSWAGDRPFGRDVRWQRSV
jgi:hypothetical protein